MSKPMESTHAERGGRTIARLWKRFLQLNEDWGPERVGGTGRISLPWEMYAAIPIVFLLLGIAFAGWLVFWLLPAVDSIKPPRKECAQHDTQQRSGNPDQGRFVAGLDLLGVEAAQPLEACQVRLRAVWREAGLPFGERLVVETGDPFAIDSGELTDEFATAVGAGELLPLGAGR